jgi:hypothetical protein
MQHMRIEHTTRCIASCCASGSKRRACATEFFDRSRLLPLLQRGSPRCLELLMRRTRPMSDEEVIAADKEWPHIAHGQQTKRFHPFKAHVQSMRIPGPDVEPLGWGSGRVHTLCCYVVVAPPSGCTRRGSRPGLKRYRCVECNIFLEIKPRSQSEEVPVKWGGPQSH